MWDYFATFGSTVQISAVEPIPLALSRHFSVLLSPAIRLSTTDRSCSVLGIFESSRFCASKSEEFPF